MRREVLATDYADELVVVVDNQQSPKPIAGQCVRYVTTK